MVILYMTLNSSKQVTFEILMTMNSSLLGHDVMQFHIQMPMFWRNLLPSRTLKTETAGSSKIGVPVTKQHSVIPKKTVIMCSNCRFTVYVSRRVTVTSVRLPWQMQGPSPAPRSPLNRNTSQFTFQDA